MPRAVTQDAVLLVVQLLAPFEVGVPLGGVLGVLSAVVLDDQLEVRIAEVEPAPPGAVVVHDAYVDPRLGESRQHDQHPEPALHG